MFLQNRSGSLVLFHRVLMYCFTYFILKKRELEEIYHFYSTLKLAKHTYCCRWPRCHLVIVELPCQQLTLMCHVSTILFNCPPIPRLSCHECLNSESHYFKSIHTSASKIEKVVKFTQNFPKTTHISRCMYKCAYLRYAFTIHVIFQT